MKIAVTGANGLLGQHLIQLLLTQGYQVAGIGRGPARIPFADHPGFSYFSFDISEPFAFRGFFDRQGRFDFLIHAAALTQVDYCEQHQEEAMNVNVQGTLQALVAAEDNCGQIIYISTDFVFDGIKGNYVETDLLAPVNWYGITKQLAETVIFEAKIPWSVVRTCLVYGSVLSGTRSNIITWVKENLEQGKPINVVSDQIRTPTYVKDLARGILKIIERSATGVFHISGREIMTPYDMALAVAKRFALDPSLITRVDASTFSQPGKRPLKTGFIIDKAVRELDYAPVGFEEGMRDMFESSQ